MTRSLDRLIRPKSIAVFGGKEARRVIEQCGKMGFKGDIWPVHPKLDDVLGHKCYRSVADLPAAPDASFVGVNRQLTIDIIRELAARGAGGAICYASGFREAVSELTDGSDLQEALVTAAGDMPIVGPNCYGFINALDAFTGTSLPQAFFNANNTSTGGAANFADDTLTSGSDTVAIGSVDLGLGMPTLPTLIDQLLVAELRKFDLLFELLRHREGRRRRQLLAHDEAPRRREMVDRSENDVEAQQQKQQVEVRRVVDVEESQAPVDDLLRRSQLGVIGRKRFELLLLDQHSDHAGDD